MPTNDEIAALFDEIGDWLLLSGESWFKVRAYREGAAALRASTEPVALLSERGELAALPKVGKAIAEKTAAYLQSGSIPLLERLRAASPPGLLVLLRAGIAPSLVRRTHAQYGIDGREALQAALIDGRLAADNKLRDAAENQA